MGAAYNALLTIPTPEALRPSRLPRPGLAPAPPTPTSPQGSTTMTHTLPPLPYAVDALALAIERDEVNALFLCRGGG